MKKMITFLLLLILTSLACSLPFRGSATVEPTSIPVSTAAAGEVEDQMATAAAELEVNGQVSVILTDTQLTSYIAQKLALNEDSPLTNPQVILQNGQIEVTGKATIGILTAPATIILEPYANQGNLGITIKEAKLGSVPLPQSTLDSISQTLNENLNDLITIRGDKFYLETIAISDGSLTLSGHLQ